jgi:hypothetical protein
MPGRWGSFNRFVQNIGSCLLDCMVSKLEDHNLNFCCFGGDLTLKTVTSKIQNTVKVLAWFHSPVYLCWSSVANVRISGFLSACDREYFSILIFLKLSQHLHKTYIFFLWQQKIPCDRNYRDETLIELSG